MPNCDWYEYRWQKGSSRYYKVIVYKDLLGDWIVTKVWGGVNSNLGNHKHFVSNNFDSAMHLVVKIFNRREKRGYTWV
jgi:hypothetical protein